MANHFAQKSSIRLPKSEMTPNSCSTISLSTAGHRVRTYRWRYLQLIKDGLIWLTGKRTRNARTSDSARSVTESAAKPRRGWARKGLKAASGRGSRRRVTVRKGAALKPKKSATRSRGQKRTCNVKRGFKVAARSKHRLPAPRSKRSRRTKVQQRRRTFGKDILVPLPAASKSSSTHTAPRRGPAGDKHSVTCCVKRRKPKAAWKGRRMVTRSVSSRQLALGMVDDDYNLSSYPDPPALGLKDEHFQ